MTKVFRLAKGTIVNHGTAVAHLPSILKEGLRPAHSRHALRSMAEERPKVEGIYVGGPAAFFGAWAAAGALFKEYALEEPNLPSLGDIAESSPTALVDMDFKNPPLAIPVVLAIELQEDTDCGGDEDFVRIIESSGGNGRHPDDTDALIWQRYRSGALLRNVGIPIDWITKMQFPKLLKVDDADDGTDKTFGDDCMLLAAGTHQIQKRIAVDQLQVGSHSWSDDMALSQSRSFNRAEVDALLAMTSLSAPANRLFNMIMQHSFFNALGTALYDLHFE